MELLRFSGSPLHNEYLEKLGNMTFCQIGQQHNKNHLKLRCQLQSSRQHLLLESQSGRVHKLCIVTKRRILVLAHDKDALIISLYIAQLNPSRVIQGCWQSRISTFLYDERRGRWLAICIFFTRPSRKPSLTAHGQTIQCQGSSCTS